MNQMIDTNIYDYICISIYCSDGNCHEYCYIFNGDDDKCFHKSIMLLTLHCIFNYFTEYFKHSILLAGRIYMAVFRRMDAWESQ